MITPPAKWMFGFTDPIDLQNLRNRLKQRTVDAQRTWPCRDADE